MQTSVPYATQGIEPEELTLVGKIKKYQVLPAGRTRFFTLDPLPLLWNVGWYPLNYIEVLWLDWTQTKNISIKPPKYQLLCDLLLFFWFHCALTDPAGPNINFFLSLNTFKIFSSFVKVDGTCTKGLLAVPKRPTLIAFVC